MRKSTTSITERRERLTQQGTRSISERRERLTQQDAQEAVLRAAVEAFEDVDLERSEKMAIRDQEIGAALVSGMSRWRVADIAGLTITRVAQLKRAYLAGPGDH